MAKVHVAKKKAAKPPAANRSSTAAAKGKATRATVALAASRKAAPKPVAKVKREARPAVLEPLLGEILGSPDDDHARLVYADALSENGDPRGTFISHHYQLADIDPLDDRYAPLLASTLRLEARHVGEWLAGYATVAKLSPAGFSKVEVDRTANAVFERGFLRRVAMPPETLAKCWDWLATREPIAGIELIVHEHLPEQQRAMPCAANFRVLKVSPDGWFTANSVGNVLAWGMPQLRDLDLSGCDLGVTGCQLLANRETDLADHFEDWRPPPPLARGQLSRLVLHGCQIGDAGAVVLAKADTLDGVVELDLGQCRLRERETLRAIRASPYLQSLVRLSLAGNRDLAGALDALAGWEVLPDLAYLALPASVSAAEVAALYPTPSSQLRELDLSAAREALVQPAAIFACADSLSHLDVGSTSLGDASWARLVREPCVARVIELRANSCSLSDAAVSALTKSPMRRLVRLDLSTNKLTDAGIAELAAWDGLEHVAWLRIGNNRRLTSASYRALIDAPGLEFAVLDVGKVTDAKLLSALRERFGVAVRAAGNAA
jgi:uncharacterized protein (TIGR02996 family)